MLCRYYLGKQETHGIGLENNMIICINNVEIMPWSPWYALLWRESHLDGSQIVLENVHNDNINKIIELDYEFLPLAARRVTNVSKNIWYDPSEIRTKSGFSITTDARKYGTEVGKILRSYFSVSLRDGEDGELILADDVNIFSSSDLPFETFNNVYFQGLQPTPKMHRMIKDSKVFISPNEKIPRVAIDSAFLGTPILIKNSVDNSLIFGNCSDRCLYTDEDDLKDKIRWYLDIDTTGEEYLELVKKCHNCVNPIFTPKNALMVIKHLVEKNGSRRIEKD